METTLQQLIDEHGFEAVSAALTTMQTNTPAPCPPGQIRDTKTGKCIDDIG